MNDATQQVLSLLAEHGPRIHALLVRITLRADVAEDLLQELFLRLSRRSSFLQAADPVGYAVRTAMRLAFDWRRSQRRRRDSEPLVGEPVSNSLSELHRLEQRDDLQQMLDSMARLPNLLRDIVVMRYLEEMPYDQIATTIDKTPHQTRALCHKGIMQLRKLWNAPENKAVPSGDRNHER